MNNVLKVLVVLAVAGAAAYYFYFKDHPAQWMQGLQNVSLARSTPTLAATPAPKRDFKDVSAQLQDEMNRIPANLRDSRQMPTHALDVKTRVAPYLQMHGEYQTLTDVCDLIISADQDFSERQGRCGLAALGPGATVQDRARAGEPEPVRLSATAVDLGSTPASDGHRCPDQIGLARESSPLRAPGVPRSRGGPGPA